MTILSGYAIKLIAISVFFALIEYIGPDGKMNGILKTVVSVIFTIVLISPAISAFKDFDVEGDLNFTQYEIDSQILENAKNYQKTYLKNQVSAYLQNKGIQSDEVIIEFKSEEEISTKSIQKITVFLSSEGISEKERNILITKIVDTLSGDLKIEREKIDVIVQEVVG